MNQARTLILASSSPYRRELLKRLGLAFRTMSPEVDESAHPGEPPKSLVRRLSTAKARKIVESTKGATVIGSDQVAILDSEQLSKPGTHEKAWKQLDSMRGQTVDFHTGLCVLDEPSGELQHDIVSYKITFRDYTDEEIERYLTAEKPYNCAGSFKSEMLGISLVKSMVGPDPSALIGLPLIKLCEMLRSLGYKIP